MNDLVRGILERRLKHERFELDLAETRLAETEEYIARQREGIQGQRELVRALEQELTA